MIEFSDEQLTEAINVVSSTHDGRIVFAALHEYCRFDGDIIAPGSPNDTYANALLRRAYIFFRLHIRPEHLKKIEHEYRRKTNDRPAAITGPDVGFIERARPAAGKRKPRV